MSPLRLPVVCGAPVLPDSAFPYFHPGSSRTELFLHLLCTETLQSHHPLFLGQSRPLPFLPHPHLCRGCPGCVSSPDLSPKLQISLSSPAWHLRLHTLGNKTHCLPSNPSLYRPYITQCPIPCVHRQSADLGASFNSLLVLFSHFPPFGEFHQHPSLSILTVIAEHGPHLLLPVIQSLLAYF